MLPLFILFLLDPSAPPSLTCKELAHVAKLVTSVSPPYKSISSQNTLFPVFLGKARRVMETSHDFLTADCLHKHRSEMKIAALPAFKYAWETPLQLLAAPVSFCLVWGAVGQAWQGYPGVPPHHSTPHHSTSKSCWVGSPVICFHSCPHRNTRSGHPWQQKTRCDTGICCHLWGILQLSSSQLLWVGQYWSTPNTTHWVCSVFFHWSGKARRFQQRGVGRQKCPARGCPGCLVCLGAKHAA